jgi:PII-like signaling protein
VIASSIGKYAMNGYQISLFMEQSRRVGHKPATEWLLQLAQELGISGATVFSAVESVGHDGRRHSVRFFELAEQPLEVVMAVTEEQAAQLLARVDAADTKLFYIKSPIEFGTLGAAIVSR